MGIPGQVAGYGPSTAAGAFKVLFDYPLSSKVRVECYDGGTKTQFPALQSLTTTDNDVFGFTSGTFTNSWIGLHDTSSAGAGATTWFPSSYNSNTSSLNLMKGSEYYVTQQSTYLSAANGSITFNMQVQVPYSAETDSTMGYEVLVRYTYTSTAPDPNWYFNDVDAADYTEMLPGTHGIVHTRAGTATAGPYLADIPATNPTGDNYTRTVQGWVVTTL